MTSGFNLPSAAWVMSQRWTLHGKPVSLSTVNQVLQKIGAAEFAPGQFGQIPGAGAKQVAPGQVFQAKGSTPENVSPAQYLLRHGFTQLTSYQPTSRFWPFQWIEGGWLLALSLLLIAAAVWLVRRRAA